MQEINKYEKFKRGQYGYKPLSEIADAYFNDTFQDSQKNMSNILRIAASVYNKIFFRYLKHTVWKFLPVDKSTRTAFLPINYGALLKVFVVDENNLRQPLSRDDDFNEIEDREPIKSCGCKECNCNNETCGAANNIEQYEEEITLDLTNNIKATKITRRKVLKNGDVVEEVVMPFMVRDQDNLESFNVEYRTESKYIGKVETKKCGCVINAPANNKKVQDLCKCSSSNYNQYEHSSPSVYNKFGRYKIDLDRGLIHVIDCKYDKILINFRPNADSCDGNEIMVPEYAEEVMTLFIHYRAIRMRLSVGDGKIEAAKSRAMEELMDMVTSLNPIDMDEIRELRSHFMKW